MSPPILFNAFIPVRLYKSLFSDIIKFPEIDSKLSNPTRLSKSYDSTIKTPIGTGATLIQESGTAGYHHLSRMGGGETGNHTISFYFKPLTNDISDLRICMLGDGGTYIKFDFTRDTFCWKG